MPNWLHIVYSVIHNWWVGKENLVPRWQTPHITILRYFYCHLSPPTTIDISLFDVVVMGGHPTSHILRYHLSHPCRNIVTSLKLINDFHSLLQGQMGPTYSISTACATSNFCILNAANHIIDGDAVSIVFAVIIILWCKHWFL